ncbi:MAG: hypothetical protein CM15mP113_3420 [Pseudomonadota bacterium]|nr:MAG: hypothetical protein CM15mP113_3420 [Pseudomonadota bacterium]
MEVDNLRLDEMYFHLPIQMGNFFTPMGLVKLGMKISNLLVIVKLKIEYERVGNKELSPKGARAYLNCRFWVTDLPQKNWAL